MVGRETTPRNNRRTYAPCTRPHSFCASSTHSSAVAAVEDLILSIIMWNSIFNLLVNYLFIICHFMKIVFTCKVGKYLPFAIACVHCSRRRRRHRRYHTATMAPAYLSVTNEMPHLCDWFEFGFILFAANNLERRMHANLSVHHSTVWFPYHTVRRRNGCHTRVVDYCLIMTWNSAIRIRAKKLLLFR